MILDVDTGIDDTLAILYAFGENDIDVVGLTTTYGNIDVEQATKNTVDILAAIDSSHIPVYKGSAHSLSSEEYTRREVTTQIHGENGVGEAVFEPSTQTPEKQHAADFLIEAALKYGSELKLVCLGPLTNLARAYGKNPEALAQVGEIIFMGGALTVPGNVTNFSEANITEDALAAKRILESNLPLKMVGLDVTIRTLLTKEDTIEWQKYKTELSQAVVTMTNFYFQDYEDNSGTPVSALHDPLAVGIALYPELAETLALDLTVELEDPARGWTVGDYEKLTGKNPSTEVCIQVEADKFLTRFADSIERILKQ